MQQGAKRATIPAINAAISDVLNKTDSITYAPQPPPFARAGQASGPTPFLTTA